MVRSEIISKLSKKIHRKLPKSDLKKILQIFFETIIQGIKDNKTFFITLIGALFVGSIQVYQFEYLNQFSVRTRKKTIQINRSYSKGTKIATFHLGSTVVCFFPEGFITKKTATPFTSYKYGEALGIV